MKAEPAAATWFTGVYLGRADQVQHARRAVARHLAGCPAADDAVLVVSELASNAIVHSASRGEFFTVRAECTRIMSGSRPKTSAAPGATGSPTVARMAWMWSRRSSARTAGGWSRPVTADGSSGRGLTWRRGSEAEGPVPLNDPAAAATRGTSRRSCPADPALARPGRCHAYCPVCDVRGSRDVSDVSRRQAASVNVPACLPNLNLMQTLSAWAQEPRPHPPGRFPSPPLGPRPRSRRPGAQPRPRSRSPTPCCWKPPRGCTTSATFPSSPRPGCTAWTAPATCVMSSTPTRCCAAWSRITPAPSSRPTNAGSPTSSAASSTRRRSRSRTR